MSANESPEFALSGPMDSYTLPKLLVQILQRKLAGVMHIESGEVKTWIAFQQGFPVGVHIPNSEVYLGMVAREMGFIDDQVFNESLMIMAQTNKLRGQVLLEMGKITQEQLDQTLHLQLMRKLTELFAINQGQYRLAPDEAIPEQVQPIRIHPFRVIHSGIKNCHQQDDLQRYLTETMAGKACRISEQYQRDHAQLGLAEDEKLETQHLQKFRLVSDFLEQSSAARTAKMMLLATMHITGLLELGDAAEAVTEKAKAEASPAAEEKDAARTRKNQERLAELHTLLKIKVKHVQGGDFLALLEIERDFSPEQLDRALLKWTKLLHPDRLISFADADTQEVAAFVAGKINEAFDILENPANRDSYLRALPLRPGETRKTDPDAALLAYEKGRVFHNKKNMLEAANNFRQAHELDPDNSIYHAHSIWLSHLIDESPMEEKRKKVLQELNALYKDSPGNFFVNRYLATAFRQNGDHDGYFRHLKKANNIRPTDIETARELRLQQSRSDKRKSASKGGLFGRKK